MATTRTASANPKILLALGLVILIVLVVTGWFGRILIGAALLALGTAIWSIRTQRPSWLRFRSPTIARATIVGSFIALGVGIGLSGGSPAPEPQSAIAPAEIAPSRSSTPVPSSPSTSTPSPTPTPTNAGFTAAPSEEVVPAEPVPLVAPAEPVPEAPDPAPAVYYENCTAARDAGAAPVYLGDPGYGKHLDRDGDGVGCE